MQHMVEGSNGAMPERASEAAQQMLHHENEVCTAFDSAQLSSIQSQAETTFDTLEEISNQQAHNVQYRESMDSAHCFYNKVQQTWENLNEIAQTKYNKLEQCYHLRQFEEQSSQLLLWLQNEGEAILHKFRHPSENLLGIKSQEKDFEKFYFTAVGRLEHGNDLLDEASMMVQTGHYEATGIQDHMRMLKNQLKRYSSELELVRQRIEETSRCYQWLDKVYDWALAATKFVATMKLDSCTNLESVEHVNKQLDLYYQENPPLEPSAFQEAMDLAAKLKNTKLQETLAMAKIRYEETQKLLKARQDAVTFAREQILNEYGSRRCSRKLLSSVSQCSLDKIDEELSDNEAIVKPVLSAVTPCGYMPSISPAMTADGGGENGGGGSFVARSWNPIRRISSPNVASPLWDPMRRKSSYSAAEECTIQEPLTSIPKNLLGSKGSLHSSSNREEHDASNRVPDDMRSHSSGSSLLSGQKVHMRRSTSMFDRKTLCTLPSEAKTCRKLPLGSMESLNSSLQDDLDWSPATAVSGPVRPCRRAGTLPLGGSLKDLKVNEAEPKNKRALQLVMNELIQTEKGYVKSLEYIIVNYIPELVKDYLPQALRGKRNVVFGNIEKIYEFHSQYFLKELDICQNSPFMVAHAFLRHENEFHLYALYNKNKPKSDSLMCEYGTEFFRKKQMELADRMDLGSYLLKPVQRMGKYALLLKQILKECPEGSPEYNDLQAAEQMVKFQLRHGNDLLAMDCLRECDINLAEQGRVIRQDQFIVWQRGSRRKCVRQIFLFQEMVLFSKARVCENGKEYYIYRSSIKTSDIGLTERIGDSDTKFEIWFRRYNGGANYILQALNPDVRNTWVAEIANILWKQAVKNRERRMTEMCSMGIGHKPFIDIKPSIDQIHDRSIPLSLRTARSRNSIAVPSYEHHTRSNKKRPHSIISLSSTSSSNSSSQSSGFSVFGSVSLHAEESFANRKSVTLSSNESGIVPDITNESADHSYHRFGTHGLLSSVISDSMTTLTPESHSSQTSHNSLVAPLVTDVSL